MIWILRCIFKNTKIPVHQIVSLIYYMYMQKYYNEERTYLLNSLSLSSINVDFDIADNLSVGSKIKINVQTKYKASFIIHNDVNIFTNDQRPRDNTLVHYQLFAARICLTSIHENTEPCMGNNYRLVWTARNYRTVTTIRLYDIVFTRCVQQTMYTRTLSESHAAYKW